jgi:hypothetical protein
MDEKELQKIERKQVFETGNEKDFIRVKDVQKLIAEVRRLNERDHKQKLGIVKLNQENQRYKQALEEIADSREGSFQATTGEGHAKCVRIAQKELK